MGKLKKKSLKGLPRYLNRFKLLAFLYKDGKNPQPVHKKGRNLKVIHFLDKKQNCNFSSMVFHFKSFMIPAGTRCTGEAFSRPVQFGLQNLDSTRTVLCNKSSLKKTNDGSIKKSSTVPLNDLDFSLTHNCFEYECIVKNWFYKFIFTLFFSSHIDYYYIIHLHSSYIIHLHSSYIINSHS